MDKDNIVQFPQGNDEKKLTDTVLPTDEEIVDPDEAINENNLEIEEEEDNSLPTPLFRLVVRQFAFAAVFVVLAVVCAIVTKRVGALAVSIIGAYMAYLGAMIIRDYRNGEILEIPLICTSATISMARKVMSSTISPSAAKTTVTFRSADEYPTYYNFVLTGNRENEFFPNVPYMVYFRKNEPKELLGYIQI